MNTPKPVFKRHFLPAILVFTTFFLSSCSKEIGVQTTSERNPEVKAAALAFTDNFQFDYAFTIFIPCANGGAGEDVVFSGTLHALTHLTVNDNSFTFKSHFQPQGITGVGSVSGVKYQATGETQSTDSGTFFNGTYTSVYVNNFKLIGQGPDNNFFDHDTFKITVNANGTVTVERISVKVDCK